MSRTPLIRADGLTKHYTTADGFLDRFFGAEETVEAVDGVDLEIYEGETLGLVGESGCGKSTLGRSLVRLVEPTSGSVRYRDTELTALSSRELREMRTNVQYIFQNPFASLNPRLTVNDIVGEALDIHGIVDEEAAEGEVSAAELRDERVRELLEIVGLKPSHANRYPHEFSGGQRQRIGIARALAVEPEFIVCDEPVSALDVSVQAQILNLLEELQDEFGISYLFIAHDLSVVEHIADRIAVMYLGEIVEIGTTEEVFDGPTHPYTEALLSAIPEPDPLWEGDRIILEGSVPSPIDPPSGCKFHTRCHRVIPPDAFDFEAGVFRGIMNLRTRLATVESSAGLHSQPDTADVPRAIRDEYELPDRLTDPDAERVLADALARIDAGELDAARDALANAFTSPCERHRPVLQAGPDHHPIACHHYDGESEDAPADDPGETVTSS